MARSTARARTLADTSPAEDASSRLPTTPGLRLDRVVALVNPRSGSVGAKAAAEMRALLAEYDCRSEVVELADQGFEAAIDAAIASAPDLLVVLAGDGTIRTTASRAGPKGPVIAPLPGGTMNMLPRALYDTTDWKAALRASLGEGVVTSVSGGVVGREAFYVAAILGAPALWAPAREAMRGGKLRLAWLYGKRAVRRAFTHRPRFSINGGRPVRGEAMVVMSPLVSRAMDEQTGLEAAIVSTADAREAIRLAGRAVVSDWRLDPAVRTSTALTARVVSASRVPALVDGEVVQLGDTVDIRFVKQAFRALAPAPRPTTDDIPA